MERICYYHKYMNLNYDGRLPLKYRFECFDPKKARDKISLYYNRHVDMVGCDSLGRRSTHYLKDRTHDVDYPHFLEKYTIKEKDYNKYCLIDEDYLIKTIKLLTERNISVVFVSPPYYWDYGFKGVNEEQKRFLGNYMDKLCSSFPSIHYLNLESDTSYTYDDFFDETHLTELGAEKFTKRLNDFVMDFMTE